MLEENAAALDLGDELIDEEEPQADVLAGLLELAASKNLAPLLDDAKLAEIARLVIEETEIDENSRSEWLEQAREGMCLASMVAEPKDYPWPGAANVKFPLLAQAGVQFYSQTVPALLPPNEIVKAKIEGGDKQGLKAKRGERVGSYLSYYLRKKMPNWRADTRRLVMQLCPVGHLFRKVWYDPSRRRACSKLCSPDSIIVNQATKALSEAPRITEKLFLYPNDVESRERDGRFVKQEYMDGDDREGAKNFQRDEGQTSAMNDSLGPRAFLEQHRWLDLDEDGYSEPYIVTVHEKTEKVVRIVANFLPKDVTVAVGEQVISLEEAYAARQQGMMLPEVEVRSIRRREYFQDYSFLPSFDGSYYGIGLGHLLYQCSEAINTLVNMQINTGHLASLGGGFIGQGPNFKKTELRFKPGEWKNVNTQGATLKDAIVPMPVTEPSPVLFAMLGLLIEHGRELGQVQNFSAEEVGANASPTTVMAMIQEGKQVHTAIVLGLFEGLEAEFGMVANLIALDPDEQDYARYVDEEGVSAAQDFAVDDMDILPVADPRAVTSAQKMGQGQLMLEMSRGGDMQRDPAVARRVLEAAGVADLDELFPQPDPQMQAMQAKIQQLMQDLGLRNMQAQIRKVEAEAGEKEASTELKRAQVVTEGAEQIERLAEAEAAEEDRLRDMNEREFMRKFEMLRFLQEQVNADNDRRLRGMEAVARHSASAGGASPGGGGSQGGSGGGVSRNGARPIDLERMAAAAGGGGVPLGGGNPGGGGSGLV